MWSIVRRAVFWEMVSILSTDDHDSAFGSDATMSVVRASPAYHELARLVQSDTMLRMSHKTLGLPEAYHMHLDRQIGTETDPVTTPGFVFFPNVTDMFYMVHDMYKDAEREGYEAPDSLQGQRRRHLGTAITRMQHFVETDEVLQSLGDTQL